jgi:hypothetical protein
MGSPVIVNPTNVPVCPVGVLPFQKLSAHRAQPLYVRPELQYPVELIGLKSGWRLS